MTTNEIKTLIQNTIAGQGSQVDIGGKLAEILGAIVDSIPSETTRPIVLTGVPSTGDTLEDLADIGLTPEEIQAASRGKRTGVIVPAGNGYVFYTITGCTYSSDTNYRIIFSNFRYGQVASSIEIAETEQYVVSVSGGVLEITFVGL